MGGERVIDDPLSVITLLPLAAGLILLVLPQILPGDSADGLRRVSRNISMGVALAIATITTMLFVGEIGNIDWTNITQGGYVLENEAVSLIPSIGVSWKVGADALSFPMIWLTAILIPVSMLVEWDAKRGHLFHPLLLIMESALIGVFVALDLFVFYVFWELTLIPMFLLILVWGGEDRRYAAMKFFIYTFTASVFMLLGILVMYFHTDPISGLGDLSGHHFDLIAMTAQENLIPSEGLRHFVWFLLLIGFATKMPSVPVHTWLPDAHVQAPTAGSMLLAGVMLKMGAYGFLRISVTIFPESTVVFIPLLIVLGMVSLVYGAWVCMGQTNLKRMVAYSSVSHMGLIFLGIATMQPLGIAGALFMMLAHGIISPLLFAVAGAFKHHYHTLEIGSMRGMAHHSPWLAGHMMFGWMASLGLPLLAGFVAEVTILIAFWMSYGWLVLLPALTLIVTAAYYLNSMQRTIFESNDPHRGDLPDSLHGEEPSDITWHENIGMFVLAGMTVLFGIMPFIFWDMMSDWSSGFVVDTMVEAMHSQGWRP
jgi:NADH-quinone oxidoreductase subunit M|tara:strand:- start:1017 stop:2633 length:1617 start_codon:yes stop_codon:yes gene_type:complete